jgi:hypothetical protein
MSLIEPGPLTRDLFSKGHESASKYDYFVCSVAGAVFAYAAEHYAPQRFISYFQLLEPCSLLILAASFYCGIRRLHFAALGIQINHLINDGQEKAGQLNNELKTNQEKYSPQAVQAMSKDMQEHYANAFALDPVLAKANAAAQKWYRWRDRLLTLGFLAIFLAKVLPPFLPYYVHQWDAINRTVNINSPTGQQTASQANTAQQIQKTPPPLPAQPSLVHPILSTSAQPGQPATNPPTNQLRPATNTPGSSLPRPPIVNP